MFLDLYDIIENLFRCRSLSVKNTADGARSDGPKSSKNTTRLIRTVQSFQRKLSSRIKDLRNGLSVKVLFFLVGFYCATAFATVIGQTGDWDIMSAGLAVVVVESIGAVTYRSSSRFFSKVRRLVAAFNYWKAGLTLGLFLDSFKYEVESLLEKYNPFNIDTDIFQILL
ncbi:Ycf20-like protein [Platanthera guangdongensis]|uniref:Ycf20-like protein n=1 Tax=Platanthera guangdongensis TaxID=2320717 RepID=A0ABR2LNZ8_9ASPA